MHSSTAWCDAGARRSQGRPPKPQTVARGANFRSKSSAHVRAARPPPAPCPPPRRPPAAAFIPEARRAPGTEIENIGGPGRTEAARKNNAQMLRGERAGERTASPLPALSRAGLTDSGSARARGPYPLRLLTDCGAGRARGPDQMSLSSRARAFTIAARPAIAGPIAGLYNCGGPLQLRPGPQSRA